MNKNYSFRATMLFMSMLLWSMVTFAQIQWPAIKSIHKPWTRWWWEGSAVNAKDLSWNLQQYQQAGLGGVEITPIYGIHGYEKQFIPFLSKEWMQMLEHTLKTSKSLGLGVDLANATGWPFGGPWVTDADASKTIYAKEYTLSAGEPMKEPIVNERKGFVRSAGPISYAVDKVLQPLTANKDLQSLAIDQVWFPGNLPLQTLMAFDEKGESIELTKWVDASGKLNWTPTTGNWKLYALFQGLHGKMVERAAPGGEGYALDHFSKKAAVNYLNKFDTAFKGFDLSYLRGYFNDSYEVDDAREQANWTPSFFESFKKIKGYDLKTQLPALFGKGTPDQVSRVIYDYRSVIDELLLESFTMPWKNWAAKQGKKVRNQSHGSPANTLDLYSVVDIPETEGVEPLRFKFASSASHVTGKQLTSAESATWLNEHFLSSLGDVKKSVDKYFLGGVNHIVYHGTAYSPKDAPWPGWLFYAAVHFQQTNPQWKDFKALNDYIARIQSFLQQGKSDADVLVYYPIVDRYSTPGNALLQHFDGMEKNFDHTPFEEISTWMQANGYTFDFFSDRQLKHFKVSGNKIVTGDHAYQVILLPANRYIPLESLQQLDALVTAGATVLFYENAPSQIPGLADYQKQQEKLQNIIQQFPSDAKGSIVKNAQGGRWILAKEAAALLSLAGVRKEAMTTSSLRFERRVLPTGSMYFIENNSGAPFEGWVNLSSKGTQALLFDPMQQRKGIAKFEQSNTGMKVWLQLKPAETILVQLQQQMLKGASFPYLQSMAPAQEIKGNWTLQFLEGGPQIPATQQLDHLVSWTSLPIDGVKDFSGIASYKIQFKKPAISASHFELQLGQVNATAGVKINGVSLGSLIGPNFNVMIPASLLKADNELEVVVANLMANRIAYMDRNKLPWKIFYNTNMPARLKENSVNGIFDASKWMPLPSGLLGPVTITPIK